MNRSVTDARAARTAVGEVTEVSLLPAPGVWTSDRGRLLRFDQPQCLVSYKITEFPSEHRQRLAEESKQNESGKRSILLPEANCSVIHFGQRIDVVYVIQADEIVVNFIAPPAENRPGK